MSLRWFHVKKLYFVHLIRNKYTLKWGSFITIQLTGLKIMWRWQYVTETCNVMIKYVTRLIERDRSAITHTHTHTHTQIYIYIVGGEGWLGFPDLWSGQKPWWNWYLTPVVNFGQVRRAQLAKSILLTSTLVPLGSFKVCSDAKERVGCGKQREATAPIQSLVKLQPWFL